MHIYTRVEYLAYNMCLISSSDNIKSHHYVVKVVIKLGEKAKKSQMIGIREKK